MSDSPYNPPQAIVADASGEVLTGELPARIARKIRNGWVAGALSTGLTLLLTLLALGGASLGGINAYAFIDTIILAALTFGVYKQSRACAVFLLAFFALNKILMWMNAPNFASLPIALVFFWFYLQGAIGTFQAHRYRSEARSKAPERLAPEYPDV